MQHYGGKVEMYHIQFDSFIIRNKETTRSDNERLHIRREHSGLEVQLKVLNQGH